MKKSIGIIAIILAMVYCMVFLTAELIVRYRNYSIENADGNTDIITKTEIETETVLESTTVTETDASEENVESKTEITTTELTESEITEMKEIIKTEFLSTDSKDATETTATKVIKKNLFKTSNITLADSQNLKSINLFNKKSKNKVDDEELYLMAHLLYGECADGSQVKMQMYIGSVALNRVASKNYPNNLHDVIYQKGQYACTWDGNFNKNPDEQTWENARKLLEEGSVLPEEVIYQAEFRQGSGVYEQIDNMYFCYQ